MDILRSARYYASRLHSLARRKLPSVPVIKGAADGGDILLVLCPPWDVKLPPLGIAYLAAYLKKQGMRPLVFDANIYLYNGAGEKDRGYWHQNAYDHWVGEEQFRRIRELFAVQLDSMARAVISAGTPCVGFSVNFGNKFFTIELMKRVRALDRKKKIILGGFGCITGHMRSFYPAELVDAFVVGEGEEPLAQLLGSLRATGRFAPADGCVVKEEGIFSPHRPRAPIMNLDSIPFPTFAEFDLSLYESAGLPLLTSRGCIGRCTFCNDHKMSAPYRFRSAGNVVEEISYHVRVNGRANFSFKDLLCNGSPRELEKLCDLLISSGMRISWDSQAISKRDLTPELLAKMRKSGCQTLIFGVESCSNAVLARMGKYFTVEDVKKVLFDARAAGINTYVNIIVGFPGETEDDFRLTCDFLRENKKLITRIGALSTCLVNNDTDLDLRHEHYGISLPDDPAIRAGAWTDAGGNCLELRRKRLDDLNRMLSSIGVGYECSNAGHEDNGGDAVQKDWKNQLTHDLLAERESNEDLMVKGIRDGARAFTGPEIVQFDVTNRCNNTCACCWNRSPLLGRQQTQWHEQELPEDLVIRTIRELSRMGTKTLFFAGGGEPFIHPGFLRILAEAKACGLKTVINTNFSLVTEEMIRRMVELKVDFIHASLLAGDPGVYGSMHPGKPDEEFTRIKKMLVLLADAKDAGKAWATPHLNVYYVVCNRNYHQLGPMVDTALGVRANSLEFVPVDVLPGKTDALLLDESQRREVVAEMKRQMKRLADLQKQYETPITFIEQGELFVKRMSSPGAVSGIYETRAMKAGRCYVGWAFSRITADGSVYPCLKADRYPVGTIRSSTFAAIWNGKEQQLFRQKTRQLDDTDPFFWAIGNNGSEGRCGCLASCDNIQINNELEKRLEQREKDHACK